jgi:hypothetical protein
MHGITSYQSEKKMKKVKLIKSAVFVVLMLVVFLLTFGCGGKNKFAPEFERQAVKASYYDKDAAIWEEAGYSADRSISLEGQIRPAASPAFMEMPSLRAGGGDTGGNTIAPAASLEEDAERKIVRRAAVRIRVENLDAADESITGLMEKLGAYSTSTVIEENSYSYTVRVPSPHYSAFLAAMDGMGRILRRSESAEDVSLRYYDLEGRLATKKELLKTFQSYLGKAKNIEEILSVERYIADLENEIDGTGKELRNLANRVDYATIDLTILGPIASAPYRGPMLSERIRELFKNFGGFLSGLVVILVGIVIYGIPSLLLLFLFYWIFFGKIGLLKKLWKAAAGRKK